MQRYGSCRQAYMLALTLSLGGAMVAACRDASSPGAALKHTSVPGALRKASRQKADFAWIGTAHNAALDDLRAEMRKPGLLSNNLCPYLATFAAGDARIPAGRAKGRANERVAIATSVLKEANICGVSAVRAAALQEEELASGLSAIVAQAQAEIDLATDRDDLVRRLSELWVSAAALNETESAIVASTLTTAQSSFEYWEVEIERASREFEAEYGDCARMTSSDGYDYEQARSICLEGGTLPALGPRYAPRPFQRASFTPHRGCDRTLGSHFKAMAKADVIGAFTGAIKGALTAGVGGIGPGAVVGGIVGSAGSWAYSAWEIYWCAMK